MDRASRLVENPGGSDWPQKLQIERYSGAEFLSNLVIVSKETQIIKSNLLPALERKRKSLAQTIVLTQAEEAVKEIRVFAQNGIISKELLERAEKEFASIKAEAVPQAVKPEILPTEQQDQEKLTFEVEGKVVSMPRKEFYATEDIGEAIDNKNPKYIQDELYRTMQRNPNIQPHHRGRTGFGQGRKLYFTEETFIQIVSRILKVKRRARPSQATQSPSSTPEPLTPPTYGKEATPKMQGAVTKQFMELLAAGEPVAKSRLMALYEGATPKNQDGAVRAEISYLRAAGFIIETIREEHRTNTAFYIYKGKREATTPPKGPSEIETPTMPETRKRRITLKDQVTLKAVAFVLSKIAARKPEEISRNIRVILGEGLPPRTTLPQVFGPYRIDDLELKTDFIVSFANAIKSSWNKDQSPENLSDQENQIIQACRELRRQNFTVPQLVREISSILRALPPRKYRDFRFRTV